MRLGLRGFDGLLFRFRTGASTTAAAADDNDDDVDCGDGGFGGGDEEEEEEGAEEGISRTFWCVSRSGEGGCRTDK